jgi:hypothetical protein
VDSFKLPDMIGAANLDLGANQRLMRQVTMGSAESVRERLMSYIAKFEKNLGPDEEVGGRIAQFGTDILVHIEKIGFYGKDLISFYGVDINSNRVQLIQNVSQVNILLVAVPKLGKEARRIGFKQDKQ